MSCTDPGALELEISQRFDPAQHGAAAGFGGNTQILENLNLYNLEDDFKDDYLKLP